MWKYYYFAIMLVASGLPIAPIYGQSADAPWGTASPPDDQYSAQKVVYDVGANDLNDFSFILDRVSFLKNLYQANPIDSSIVLVLHGNEVPFFSVKNFHEYSALMSRAHSLAIDGIVDFRMCAQAASAHGIAPEDIHGFVRVVKMADAEVVKLQQEEGYVYMR